MPAIGRAFDYLVPDGMAGRVGVGTMVRIQLQGRRVGGWVVGLDSQAPEATAIKPLAKVTGWGPPPDLVRLSDWASYRWAGRAVPFLRTASPARAVTTVPPPLVARDPVPSTGDQLAEQAFEGPAAAHPPAGGNAKANRSAISSRSGFLPTVLRLPPAADRFPLVLAACRRGNALVLVPSVDEAKVLGKRLRRAGVPVAVHPEEWAQARGGATVVGSRSAAWAPVVDLAAVLVLDEHDEAYKQEQTPGWHARDVVVRRAQEAGVPCVLASPCPTLEAQDLAPVLTPSRSVERQGWPLVDVVDLRKEDTGRTGLYSARLVDLLRDGGRVVCVLNRKGRARLLACASCAELATCERCAAALVQPEAGTLACLRCDLTRPTVCSNCGGTRLKLLRVGVSRAADDLRALTRTEVVEVTGESEPGALPDARVYVGTEAVLHQVPTADVVAFLDLDQELLAPRYRAAEEALGLLARASRLLRGRREREGRLVLQTRLPEHEVVQAALHADPARVSEAERSRRRLLGFPPTTAMAAVSGEAADEYVLAFEADAEVDLLGPRDGTWLLRAPDHDTLLPAVAAAPRPPGRLRIDVDPLRL